MYVLAIPIGLFYIFAGVIALRMIKLGSLMDHLIEAIELQRSDNKERIKTNVLTVGAYLTAASGAALATLSAVAVGFFIVNSFVQGAYLVWASKALPPADADEAKGRQQTTNAFVVYVAAAAFVGWLYATGGLRAWPQDPAQQALEFVVPFGAILINWVSLQFPTFSSGGLLNPSSGVGTAIRDDVAPKNLRLRPEFAYYPLWDADTGENVSHYHLDIPIDLSERIEQWDDLYQAILNVDDPASSKFATDAAEQEYVAEGKEIVAELRKVWAGNLEVDLRFQ